LIIAAVIIAALPALGAGQNPREIKEGTQDQAREHPAGWAMKQRPAQAPDAHVCESIPGM
jgi:hypothetical protein